MRRVTAAARDPASLVARVCLGVAAVGVVTLGVLIARELAPHHARVASNVGHESDPVVTPSPTAEPAPVPTSRAAASIAQALAPKVDAPPLASAASAAPAVPGAAVAISAFLEDPAAYHPANVSRDAKRGTTHYSYDGMAPYHAGEIIRDEKNPQAWFVALSGGPKSLDELGPKGSVHEAVVQTDADGKPFATWFAVEGGPLAPAYAMQTGDQIRVLSRAYLESHRSEYPPSFTQVLDRK
jgi:hypothetical protein